MASIALQGIIQSLRQYHGNPEQQSVMDALYAQFVGPGDLAFDIGAHVGDRVSSFRRLGARVVAVEPQPLACRVLRLIHGRDDDVKIEQAACGSKEGRLNLQINSANPTISTASSEFTKAADGALGWEGQLWDSTVEVAATTLDALISRYGEPQFVKIDVEGFESDVLAGLSHQLKALSFEFTTIQREIAIQCLDKMEGLGTYAFNLALGESQQFEFQHSCDADSLQRHIMGLPHSANSGDIYAIRLASGKADASRAL